jgi:hypothetical protein
MNLRQRLLIWGATLIAVLVTGIFAWRSVPAFPRLELREPALPLPDPNKVLDPGAGGGPMLLVVVENTPEARPQSGLAEACLVYAVPTEARITRFLAAYCQQKPSVIGPIRSVRKYMLDIAGDVGAILVHAGHSEEARLLIARDNLPVLNEFSRPEPFWRDPRRKMPHNLYTAYDRLQASLEKKPIETPRRRLPYSFSYEAPTSSPTLLAGEVVLDYGRLYDVRYRYDATTKRYLREQDGRPHADASGRQIAPVSVLVVFVHWRDVLVRGSPSSQITLSGDGRLAIVSGGQLIEGRWTRAGGGPLKLATMQGDPVVLPPGPVWIEFFPTDRPFSVRGEGLR